MLLIEDKFHSVKLVNSKRFLKSSYQRCSIKKGILENFAKFTGKDLCWGLFFKKVASLRPATLLEKRLLHRCFAMNFAKFLRTPFLHNTSGQLLPIPDSLINKKYFSKFIQLCD